MKINGKDVLNMVPDTMTLLNDFEMAATVVCTAGVYTEIARYEVGDDEAIQFGYGMSSSYSDARGRLYAKLQDATPAQVNGEMKFTIENKNDNLLIDLGSYRTNKLDEGVDDARARYPFPKQLSGASPRRIIKIYFKADATATLVKANSSIEIDITRTNLK